MHLPNSLEEITKEKLQLLIENGIAEGKMIEYKSALHIGEYDTKKEFLADVSSFANASGGHIVFGIQEEGGLPVNLSGLENIDADAEIQRMENLLRDNLDPRIQGYSIKAIPLSNSRIAIVLFVPMSWSKPHVVKFQRHWRYYSRNSAGKYPLDHSELRNSILMSESISEKIRAFRSERVGNIIADEAPVTLASGAKILIDLIPFISFEPTFQIDFKNIENNPWMLGHIYGSPQGHRYNLDGFLSLGSKDIDVFKSYVLVFRNGIVESVDTNMLRDSDPPFIPSKALEKNIIEVVTKYLQVQRDLGIAPPITLMLTLIGVSGFYMAVKGGLDTFGKRRHQIQRDVLLIPELIINDYLDTDVDVASTLRPIFDAVWNAAGWPRSMGYDEVGEWGKGLNF